MPDYIPEVKATAARLPMYFIGSEATASKMLLILPLANLQFKNQISTVQDRYLDGRLYLIKVKYFLHLKHR